MHIVYSALNILNDQNKKDQPSAESIARYQAYQHTCNKYSKEIAAIQKYIPGWTPKFRW